MAGGVHGRGCAWQGVCMAGGMCGMGHAWQGACMAEGCAWQILRDMVNEQAVCILLECILVYKFILLNSSNSCN